MTRVNYIIVFLILIVLQCAGQQVANKELFWPHPPEQPRIKFLYAFSGENDIKREKSWWRKAVEFVFGKKDENGSMVRPQGIAVDNKNNIYITDTGLKGVHVFNFINKSYKFINGKEENRLVSPIGVAISSDNKIFVTDSELKTIFVFDTKGELIYSFSDRIIRPTGISIIDDEVYIVDTGANQLIVCDLLGTEKTRYGKRGTKDGEFNYPVSLCGSLNVKSFPDIIFVVDAMNFRIQEFKRNGLFVNKFGKLGDGVGDFARPKSIAVDSEGHVYVVDALFDIVQIFDKTGQILMAFGGSGSGFGNFSLPTGIAIDAQDRIYVVDSGNRRVQVFQYIK